MSDSVGTTTSSDQPGWRAGAVAPVAALGVAAGITGYAAAWLRQRQRRRSDTTWAGVSDNHQSVGIAASGYTSQGVPQGVSPSAAGSGAHQEDAPVVHVVDLKRAVVRRPGLAIALTAVVVAVVTWAVTVLVAAPGPNDPTPMTPPPAKLADLMPRTDPMPLADRSTLIPMSEGGESSGRCTADGVCTGQVFTMDLGGDGPWVVTGVGYRPLEVLPGRRVTRIRWELRDTDLRSDRDTVAFTQTSDAPDPDLLVTYARVRVDGHRAMRIIAVVEASIPAPGAARTYFPPFNAYGYPDESETFPARLTPDTVTRPVAPFTVSRAAIGPGRQAEDSATAEGPSQ